ncbi:hypothetical protein [Nostoc sp.]
MAERRKLTTNPLTSTEGVALQVDDVYVPLGLIERKKQSGSCVLNVLNF